MLGTFLVTNGLALQFQERSGAMHVTT